MPTPKLDPGLTTPIGSAALYDPNGQIEQWELNPDLRFPHSIAVYDEMRKTDGQVDSVAQAITLPILQTDWNTRGSLVRPEVMEFCDAELGLQLDEDGHRRATDSGLEWDDFIRQALIHLFDGFMAFERTYEIATEPDPITGLSITAHLASLSPRMPRSVVEFLVDQRGNLQGVKQLIPKRNSPLSSIFETVTIPADRLVFFCKDREGADYAGRSILRSAWKNWMLKDKFLRLDVMAGERNSMGLPKVTYPSHGSRAKALAMGRAMRAGVDAALAVEEGYLVELMGMTGSIRDLMPSIQYHDQQIGRASLAMFLNLGHDRGSQSLGETFLELFTKSLNAVTRYMGSVITKQVIRDLVRVNFGADEPYPTLVADPITQQAALDAAGLKALSDGGFLTPDGDLEDDLRRRYGLVKANPSRRPKPVAPPLGQQVLPIVGAPGGAPTSAGTADPANADPTASKKPLAASRAPEGLDAINDRIAVLAAEVAQRKVHS